MANQQIAVCAKCGHSRHYHGNPDCVQTGDSDTRAGIHGSHDVSLLLDDTFFDLTASVPSPRIIGYFPADGHKRDTISGETFATAEGTIAYVAGKVELTLANGAFDFNGTTALREATAGRYDFKKAQKFSISFWIKSTNTGVTQMLMGNSNGVSSTNTGWRIFLFTNDRISVDLCDGTTEIATDNTTDVVDGTWHHVVITWDATTMTIYVDNSAETGTGTLAGDINSGNLFAIGAESDLGTNFTGQIDDLAIFDEALTSAQVSLLYNSGNGLKIAHNLLDGIVYHAEFNGNLTNRNFNTLTRLGAGTEKYASGLPCEDRPKSAFDFDNTNWLQINPEGFFDFEHTSPFSVAMWVNRGASVANQILFAKRQDITNSIGYSLHINTGEAIVFELDTGAGTETNITSGTNLLALGQWHHVVATYAGNSNENGCKIYIDGVDVSAGVTNLAIGATILNNVLLALGAHSTVGGNTLVGQMQQAIVWNRTLGAAEITALYNSGSPLGL